LQLKLHKGAQLIAGFNSKINYLLGESDHERL